MSHKIVSVITFIFLIGNSLAWDNDDLEVFDVVEEVNRNFYEVLGVAQDASASEIKAAYRTLTLKLHPDKNDAPDAEVQFRNLVSVYNILRDPGKREKYNDVLVNGLPNWRSAVYYYRHVRKMGLAEMSIILFIIISIGQYIVGWAAYAEKRYTAESVLGSRLKKLQKKSVANVPDLNSVLSAIPRPSVKDTLPFQIVRGTYTAIVSIPSFIRYIKDLIKKRKEDRMKRKIWEEEEEERLRKEAEELAEIEAYRKAGKVRKRRGFVPQERDCLLDPVDEPENVSELQGAIEKAPKPPVITGGLWTDDDLAELVRLVKKYPGGSSERWERIAEAMNRSVPEVTHMAAKMKENCYKLPGQEENEYVPPEPPKKTKTRGGKLGPATETNGGPSPSAEATAWSQTQQKALEAALSKYPKGPSDRWEKIAKCVPDKTKEDCMLRYKYLADVVKKQKQREEEEKAAKAAEDNSNSNVYANSNNLSNVQSNAAIIEDLDGV